MLKRRLLFLVRVRGYVPTRPRTWLLLALSACYVVGVVLALVSNGAWATLLLLANSSMAVLDWRG